MAIEWERQASGIYTSELGTIERVASERWLYTPKNGWFTHDPHFSSLTEAKKKVEQGWERFTSTATRPIEQVRR